MLSKNELTKLSEWFELKNIEEIVYNEPIYYNDIYGVGQVTQTYKQDMLYKITVDEKFMDMLLGYIQYMQGTGLFNSNHSIGLYKYFDEVNQIYINDKKEKKLQEKYPDLKQIQKDYEITKKLVVDQDDL